MNNIKSCPCGKTPDKLIIIENGQGTKYCNVCGNCCGEWMIEFRTNYESLESEKCMTLAIEAWNNAPRIIHEAKD